MKPIDRKGEESHPSALNGSRNPGVCMRGAREVGKQNRRKPENRVFRVSYNNSRQDIATTMCICICICRESGRERESKMII